VRFLVVMSCRIPLSGHSTCTQLGSENRALFLPSSSSFPSRRLGFVPKVKVKVSGEKQSRISAKDCCVKAAAAAAMTNASGVEDASPSFGYSMYPVHRCKTIHIVRHGQGYHNVAGELDRANYMSWEFEDAALTDLGWQQADALHDHVVKNNILPQVELVVVSPLLRTMQTAAAVWGGGELADDTKGEKSALMLAENAGVAKHAAISSVGAPRFVANEWCREQNGLHPCDKRSSVSSYKTRFPAIDFSEIETEEDTWWSPKSRETKEELWVRGRTFIKWLMDRPETRIAVVSHSSFIFHLCHLFGEDYSDVVRKELQQGYRNCEMRSVVLCDPQAASPPNPINTEFAGGLYFNEQSAQGKVMGVSGHQVHAEDQAVPQADDLLTVPKKKH